MYLDRKLDPMERTAGARLALLLFYRFSNFKLRVQNVFFGFQCFSETLKPDCPKRSFGIPFKSLSHLSTYSNLVQKVNFLLNKFRFMTFA